MGRGIAEAYAFGGQRVLMVDAKDRDEPGFAALAEDARTEIADDLAFLATIGVGQSDGVENAVDQITFVKRSDAERLLSGIPIHFECVPETTEAKSALFEWACAHAASEAVMASTSSTMAVDDLASMGTNPGRFVNAHWLNPAMLMPLVEVARGSQSSEASVERLVTSLEAIGKSPVVMKNSPGYIVPRIQALAMNEAARLVEEGVASAEDIDKAIRLGFGIRYAVLGMVEFIDFGGNDILYYASDYLSKTVDADRYKAPGIVDRHMAEGRNGLRDGAGFYDWSGVDAVEYRQKRLGAFVSLLKAIDLAPKGQTP
ncbi:MAG: 3-hydroxyacyl-CoA dehydrogenase [Alphaproteobacteria bacterium]|nr:MAG: 3-hydroxyacyl-CoA dehydrogenase [Alphaproteobacteria bacterium]